MNNIKAEYAIITSFKFKDNSFVWNMQKLWAILGIKIRIILRFYRADKVKKYQRKLQDLKANHLKIIGHPSLLLSLFRGFDKLRIPFTYNQITHHTKYIILCWADAKDIERVRKLRLNNPNIKCVVTAPTACKYDYEYQYRFAQESCIDFSLVGSNWVKEAYKLKIPRIYWDKIIIWASGVVFNYNVGGGENRQIHQIQRRVMVYFKNLYSKRPKEMLKQDCEKIKKMIESKKLELVVVEYGSYHIDDYRKSLQKVDLVIVFQEGIIETQGLSIAESWAENKPTFINYKINEFGGTTAPYLCTQNGLYYKDFDELQKYIDLFYNDINFRHSFAPANFVRENMSNEASVKNLIKICNGANKNETL